jgi:hypothetical protein
MMQKRQRQNWKLWALLLTLAFVVISGGCGGSSDDGDLEFAGGSGTSESPWEIANAAQLDNVRNHLDGNFILTSDIDLSSYENWVPVGVFEPASDAPEDAENPNMEAVFSGTFDGNGHTISNIRINHPQIYVGAGLFGVNFGSIRDLVVKNVNVTGYYLTGGVVGMQGGELENITLSGNNKIKGSQGAGGIAGVNFGAIKNCSAAADIVILNDPAYPESSEYNGNAGGILVGGMESGLLVSCSVTGGTVSAENVENCWGLGGLGGAIYRVDAVTDCHVENVTVTASGKYNSRVGGLLGFTGTYDEKTPTLVSGCTVTNVKIIVSDTTTQVGGLVGGNWESESDPIPSRYAITNCSTSGTITGGKDSVGSIAGYAYKSTVENCTASVTWSGGTLNQVGLMENE